MWEKRIYIGISVINVCVHNSFYERARSLERWRRLEIKGILFYY